MKFRLDLDPSLTEVEIVVRSPKLDSEIVRLQEMLEQMLGSAPSLTFYKDRQAYYFPLEDLLFFETENEHVVAHTATDAFQVEERLYELEELLPRYFVRCSKSCIVNTQQIYSVSRNLSSSSLILFRHTHKEIYASRHYARTLRDQLEQAHIKR